MTPLEKGDARKLERELKIKFDWHEADKNLAKEERNKPIDLTRPAGSLDNLLQMETRSWKTEEGASSEGPDRAAGAPHPRTSSGSNHGRSHSGGRSSGGRSQNSSQSGGRNPGRRRSGR